MNIFTHLTKGILVTFILLLSITTSYAQWLYPSAGSATLNGFYIHQGTTFDHNNAGIRVNNGSASLNSKDGSILYLNRDVRSASVVIGAGSHEFYFNQGITFDATKSGIRVNNGSASLNSKDGSILYLNRDVPSANVVIGAGSHEFYFNQGITFDATRSGIRVNNGSASLNSKNGSVLYLNRDVNADVSIQSSGVDIAFFKRDGNVGIGTTNPGNYKLAVEGKIGAREIVVTTASWADYVFENTYKLRPLSQVESFIKENKHLPEVPSAKEVEANGINLGKMDALLLKKIEELTLYVIKLNKENEVLRNRVESLEGKKK